MRNVNFARTYVIGGWFFIIQLKLKFHGGLLKRSSRSDQPLPSNLLKTISHCRCQSLNSRLNTSDIRPPWAHSKSLHYGTVASFDLLFLHICICILFEPRSPTAGQRRISQIKIPSEIKVASPQGCLGKPPKKWQNLGKSPFEIRGGGRGPGVLFICTKASKNGGRCYIWPFLDALVSKRFFGYNKTFLGLLGGRRREVRES